eukprot:CAMPEP_0182534552 /NCGR_PEP_ID=MMETSP1323-20130603/15995_1 /TAXON_ID=236787 /ORGANISM="Florenciella parvula, Strain RCC1693" /LENGTH=54 /DNA_ID=CAMNT_0024744583 /DNA_START=249 /DNA_END=410 /DNA_ORIENTATION=+
MPAAPPRSDGSLMVSSPIFTGSSALVAVLVATPVAAPVAALPAPGPGGGGMGVD